MDGGIDLLAYLDSNMTDAEKKKYIIEQRKKGVSDDQIYKAISKEVAPAPQRSWAGEIMPAAFSVGGGIIGGLAGAALGGVGAVPGAIAGAAGGGALGETIQQKIEKGYGQRTKLDTAQIAGQGVIGGITEATGIAALKLGGKALQVTRPTIVKTLSKLSGYADDVVTKALERSPGTVAALRTGETALVDVVKKTASGVSKMASDLLQESQKTVESLSKLSVGGRNATAVRTGLLEQSTNFVGRLARNLNDNFNIGLNKTGELLFNRSNLPSRIASKADQNAIQEGFQWVNTIKKNTTVKQIDAVLERLMVLKGKTPAGTPTGGETKRILTEMMDEVVGFVKSVPQEFGEGYAKYAQFLQENLPKRVMINEAKELFGSTANLTAKEITKIEKRLLQIYNTGNLAVREAATTIGQKVGSDVGGTVAGTLIKSGRPTTGVPVAPRGWIIKAVEAIPRQVVQNYVKTGKITGEIAANPIIRNIMKTTGLSIKFIMQEISANVANKTSR